MGTPERIAWADEYMTGVPLIDDQHKILINIINDVHHVLYGKYSRIALQRILLELRGYILYHFSAEELLMTRFKFDSAHPDKQQVHLQQHQGFSEWLDNLEQDIRHNRPVSLQALFTYLREWLINHILHTDKHFADFLNSRPEFEIELTPAGDAAARQAPQQAPVAKTNSPGHSHILRPAG